MGLDGSTEFCFNYFILYGWVCSSSKIRGEKPWNDQRSKTLHPTESEKKIIKTLRFRRTYSERREMFLQQLCFMWEWNSRNNMHLHIKCGVTMTKWYYTLVILIVYAQCTPQYESTMSSWIFNGYENKIMKKMCMRHDVWGMGHVR